MDYIKKLLKEDDLLKDVKIKELLFSLESDLKELRELLKNPEGLHND